MEISYTRTVTKDIDIKGLTNRMSDIIYDYVCDEIGTEDFTDEDYEMIQPMINACILAIGKKLVEKYSTTEHI